LIRIVPLYEYFCKKDGRFELIRKFSDPPLKACPTCGRKVEKLVSSPAIQFKGAGWYVTDYAGKGQDGFSKKESKDGKDGSASAKSDGAKAETGSTSDSASKAESASKKDGSSSKADSSKSSSSSKSPASGSKSAASGGSSSK
jgi:putative FmdB family regulatory protein